MILILWKAYQSFEKKKAPVTTHLTKDRKVTDSYPQKTNLKSSSAIEQFSDTPFVLNSSNSMIDNYDDDFVNVDQHSKKTHKRSYIFHT